jgi:hypothetical protein
VVTARNPSSSGTGSSVFSAASCSCNEPQIDGHVTIMINDQAPRSTRHAEPDLPSHPDKRQRQVATRCRDRRDSARPDSAGEAPYPPPGTTSPQRKGSYAMKHTRHPAMVAKVPPVLTVLLIFDSGSAGRSPRQPADSDTSGIDKYR